MWITTNCGKFLKRWEYQTTLPASSETYMQVGKQELELDMEQQTGSKLEDFVHSFASLWDECNCVVVKHSMALPFFGFGMKNWHFPVLWSLLSLPNLLACWVPALSHFFDPGKWPPPETELTWFWMSECLQWKYGSAVACHGGRGFGCSNPGRCSVWHKSS